MVTPTARIQMGVSQIVSFDMWLPDNGVDQLNGVGGLSVPNVKTVELTQPRSDVNGRLPNMP